MLTYFFLDENKVFSALFSFICFADERLQCIVTSDVHTFRNLYHGLQNME